MAYDDTPAKRKRIQQALIDQHYDCGPDGADGVFGTDTGDAIVAFRKDRNIVYPPHPATVDTDLMRELGLLTIQDPVIVGVAAAKGIDLLSLIKTIGLIEAFVKGTKMDSSANVNVISSWLSTKNWAAIIAILTNIAAIFHIVIPADLAPTVQTFVTSAAALYILIKNTWFTTTVTAASAKKL